MKCLVCVDAGTTNTRVWLTRGMEILAHAQANVGVRDTARDGTPTRLFEALKGLIAEVRQRAGSENEPACIAAAGMITSRLGLAEVPHVRAPAGTPELSAALKSLRFEEVSDLPVCLVPGVRSGREGGAAVESDVMRGEETLCVGLIGLGLAQPSCTVLNLGSHWKAIRLDDQGRIEASLTTLTGELIHVAQTQTILASAVPSARPTVIDASWCEAGMAEKRRSGLARALFCVRLLELEGRSTPEQRLSFLAGAFVQSDLDGFLNRGVLNRESPVTIAGGGVLGEVWERTLAALSVPAVRLSESDVEAGLLAGLRRIVEGAA